MRTVKFYIFCFIMFCAGVTPSCVAQGQLFSVILQTPPTPFKAGSDIRLKLTTTNTSDHDIRFARGFGEQEFDFEIEVRDEKGQTPPLTESYRHLKEHPTSRWGSYSTYVLEPGKSLDEELVITKLYVITQPGKYTVSVMRGQRPMWQTSGKAGVRSNSVNLTVSP